MHIIFNCMGISGRKIICALKFDSSLGNTGRPCLSH